MVRPQPDGEVRSDVSQGKASTHSERQKREFLIAMAVFCALVVFAFVVVTILY
jgi:hypothetical protein